MFSYTGINMIPSESYVYYTENTAMQDETGEHSHVLNIYYLSGHSSLTCISEQNTDHSSCL